MVFLSFNCQVASLKHLLKNLLYLLLCVRNSLVKLELRWGLRQFLDFKSPVWAVDNFLSRWRGVKLVWGIKSSTDTDTLAK